jgi:hypothetical protein
MTNGLSLFVPEQVVRFETFDLYVLMTGRRGIRAEALALLTRRCSMETDSQPVPG